MSKFDPKAWINLEKAQLLLLDDHIEGTIVLAQIASAFGVRKFFKAKSIDEAKEIALHEELHLILANANLKSSSAYDFIHWLRRAKIEPNSFTPIILITGHTQLSNIRRARDCGANFVMAKPVSPAALLERIGFVAREKKPFVSCGDYLGPDRRFHDVGPPPGIAGRRHDDKALEMDEAEGDGEAAGLDAFAEMAPLAQGKQR